MFRPREYLYATISKGAEAQLGMTLRRKVLYVNIAALVALFILTLLDIAYLWEGSHPLSNVLFVHLPFYILFGMIPWMNQRGWREAALWTLMLSATLSTLLAVYVSLGSYFYTHYYFIVFAVVPIAFFHSNRALSIIFLFVLNMSLFFFVSNGGVIFNSELLQLSEFSRLLMRSFNVVGALIAYLTFVWMIEVVAERSERELEHLSVTDVLTELPNRRFFDLAFQQEISKSMRRKDQLVLAILDIDFFKKVNDTYGHDVGDEVLKRVAQILRQSTRAGNVIARIGGEEFAVLFPGTPLHAAQEAAERMRLAIESNLFVHQDLHLNVTISIGLAQVEIGGELGQAFKLADDALYAAKRMGRNRVVVFEA